MRKIPWKKIRFAWLLAAAIPLLVLSERSESKSPATQLATSPATSPAIQPDTRPASRPVLSERSAKGKASTEPSRITLHYTDAPLADVIADFSRQAGCELAGHDSNFAQYAAKLHITLDMKDATFWDVLGKFIDQGWIDLDLHDPQIQFHLPRQFRRPLRLDPHSAALAGPLIVSPFQCREYVRYAYGDSSRFNQNRLTLSLIVMAEPKAGVIGIISQTWAKQCIDDRGQSLLSDGHVLASGNLNWFCQLQTNLRDLPNRGDKIARLSGSLQIQAATSFDPVSIPAAQIPGYTKTVNGITFIFKALTQMRNLRFYTLEISAEQKGSNALGFDAVSHLIQSLRLQDDGGAAMESLGSSSPSGDGRTLIIMTRFLSLGQPVRPPATLLWSVPVDIHTFTVPFELHDIPLPEPPTDPADAPAGK